MKSAHIKQILIASGLIFAVTGAAADTITASGSFTNASGSNQGAAVTGAPNWYFNNVRASGLIAVDNTSARSGNASVSMSGPANAKADLEYLANAVDSGGNYTASGSLGSLSALSSMSYDWYRDSSSAANAGQHASLRVLIDTDGNLSTTTDRGGLVFESIYNTANTSVDAWITEVVSDSTYLWNFGTPLGFGANINASPYAYDATLAQWKAFFPLAQIVGFSSGIGSGWQSFSGAVDNIGWTIDGVSTLSNFELAQVDSVPEPGSMALLAMAALGMAAVRRRKHTR